MIDQLERVAYTKEQAAYMAETFGLRKLSNWNDRSFRDAMYSHLAGNGLATPEGLAEREAAQKKFEVDQAAERRLADQKRAEEAEIPFKFDPEWNQYDNDYWPAGANSAEAWTSSYRAGMRKDLILVGRSGVGKSHLLARILHDLISTGHRALWVNLENLRNYYEDGIHERQTRAKATDTKRRAQEIPLLVLDDLAKSPSRESDGRTLSFFSRALYDIVESRQRAGLSTLYSTEFAIDSDELRERVTESVVNRITDRCTIIDDAPLVKYRLWLAHKEKAGNARQNGGAE